MSSVLYMKHRRQKLIEGVAQRGTEKNVRSLKGDKDEEAGEICIA
jgi:hypothetical protein